METQTPAEVTTESGAQTPEKKSIRSYIAALADELRKEREYWQGYAWERDLPEPPEPPRPDHYRLQWVDAEAGEQQPAIALTEARKQIANAMGEYVLEDKPGRMMLVRAQPGVGKTHAAVEIAQMAAKMGMRVLYAMPTHAHFDTLAAMQHFDGRMWYHWLSYSATNPDTGEPMCKFSETFTAWTKKGYPGIKLCDSLCAMYKAQCPYRQQAHVVRKIIAGTHNHLSLGLAIDDFDLVIIDELPMGAFLKKREIPRDGIQVKDAGPVGLLGKFLKSVPLGDKESLRGRDLMERTADWLEDAAEQVAEYKELEIPWISKPENVDGVGYHYLPDLLRLSVGEVAAYRAGQAAWLERIILDSRHLTLYQRAEPWAKLPGHVIALDATGNAEAYSYLLRRKVEVVKPNVERVGRVYQVVSRLNGIGLMIAKIKDSNGKWRQSLGLHGRDMLELCIAIKELKKYKRVGIVTFLGGVAEFAEVFGEENVLHFYGQRGSNNLVGVDALFVVGCPQPADSALMDTVKMLKDRRMRPFTLNEADGTFLPARCEMPRRYQIFRDGQQAERMVSGFWRDSDLEVVADVYRKEELEQAIHRARPINYDCDVWLLTSTPTAETLTEIYDQPEEIFGNPPVGWKAWIKIKKAIPSWQVAGTRIDYAEVSQVTGLSESYMRRVKILAEILKAWPEEFEVAALQTTKQGRPKTEIVARPEIPEIDWI